MEHSADNPRRTPLVPSARAFGWAMLAIVSSLSGLLSAPGTGIAQSPSLAADGPPSVVLYRVTGVARGDVLNVRALPDSYAPVIGALVPETGGIVRTGRKARNLDMIWHEIRAGGMRGWVAARYITRDVAAGSRQRLASSGEARSSQIMRVQAPGWTPQVVTEGDAARPAAKSVALVIGNGRYPMNSSLPQLRQPAIDAHDLAGALRKLDYHVIELADADLVEMRRGLDDFQRRLRVAESGFVFFGGHSLHLGDATYLLPIGSRIRRTTDLRRHAVALTEVLAIAERQGPLAVHVLIDASRDNRLVERLNNAKDGAAKPGKRSDPPAGRGEPSRLGIGAVGVASEHVTLISVAEPGRIVADGRDRNSPVVRALLARLGSGSDTVGAAMASLSAEVVRSSPDSGPAWRAPPLKAAAAAGAGADRRSSDRAAAGKKAPRRDEQ